MQYCGKPSGCSSQYLVSHAAASRRKGCRARINTGATCSRTLAPPRVAISSTVRSWQKGEELIEHGATPQCGRFASAELTTTPTNILAACVFTSCGDAACSFAGHILQSRRSVGDRRPDHLQDLLFGGAPSRYLSSFSLFVT